jgi:hypothetical protein
MIQFVNELKQKYKIGMITDNKADRINAIVENQNWEELYYLHF